MKRRLLSLYSENQHLKALSIVRSEKKTVNVLFFVIHESVWKLDSVYKEMEASEKFAPIIIICPFITLGDVVMHRDMEKAYRWFKGRGYKVRKGVESGNVVKVKKTFNPGLIFYTNPHSLTMKEFMPTGNLEVLSAYIPYTHHVSKYENYQPQYNQLFHSLMWKIYTTNDLDLKIFQEYSDKKGRNVCVTGYPGIEGLLEDKRGVDDPWKPQNKRKCRIIWAPHHTIEKNSPLGYSTFLTFAKFMMELSKDLKEVAQFAFKPHPLLRDKLSNENVWGRERTQVYFNYWENAENTQLEQGGYTGLFVHSDALVHDSASFLAEYLYLNKPVLFLYSGQLDTSVYSPFGLLCLEVHDKCNSEDGIHEFVHSVLNGSGDYKKGEREDLICKCLLNFNELPSKLIIDDLEKELNI